jgi:hypothetical protein
MPQFYFHLWRGGHLTPDEAGVALAPLDAAKRWAERIASSIIGQDQCGPESVSGWDIEVTDEAGRMMLIVPIHAEQGRLLNKQAA